MAVRAGRGSASNRLLWAVQTAVALFIAWMALDGLDNLALGAVFSLIGAAAGVWLVPGESYPWRPVHMLFFAAYFVRASFVGGVDVAFRALHPRMPITPEVSTFKLDLDAGLPRTLMVAVISLLPGTLSVQLLEDSNELEVHALSPNATKGLPDLQERIRRLFALRPPSPEQSAAAEEGGEES
jgi:multicomponent Na+:H+ antiporter subunit E